MFSKKTNLGDVKGDDIHYYVFGMAGQNGEEDIYLSVASSKQGLMLDIFAFFDDIIEKHNSKTKGHNPCRMFGSKEENELMWEGLVAMNQGSLDKLKLFRTNLEINIDKHLSSQKIDNFLSLDEQNSFFLFAGMRPRKKLKENSFK